MIFFIFSSSSAEKSVFSVAFKLSASWATELAPMMTLVTRSSFNSQASDISARVCPREAATSLSALILQRLVGQCFFLQESPLCHARIFGNTIQVAVGQQALRQRGEGDEAGSVPFGLLQDTFFFRFAVEEIVSALIEQAVYIPFFQVFVGKLGRLFGIFGDSYIECFALPYDIN